MPCATSRTSNDGVLAGELRDLRTWLVKLRARPTIETACHRVGGYHGIVRGSPKCGRALVAAKRVMCEMRSPSSVSTSSESARPTSVCGSLTYWPNAGWELARVEMRRWGLSRLANAWA